MRIESIETALNRVEQLNVSDEHPHYPQKRYPEIDRLYRLCRQLAQIKKTLEEQLIDAADEAKRVADNIAKCFDEKMCELLRQDYQPHKTEHQFSQHISNLAEALKTGTLAKKEQDICSFALDVALTEKPTPYIQTQYQQVQKIPCDDKERPVKSEAYLLLRDQVRGNPKKQETQEFVKRCALSTSEKVKKIGWIIAGVVAIAAFVALTVLTCGATGVAAAAFIGATAAVGFVAGAAVSQAGLSAEKLIKNTKNITEKNIADVVYQKNVEEPADIIAGLIARTTASVTTASVTTASVTTASVTTEEHDDDSANVISQPASQEGGNKTPPVSRRASTTNFFATSSAAAETGENVVKKLTLDELQKQIDANDLKDHDLSGISVEEMDNELLRKIYKKYYNNDDLEYKVTLSEEQIGKINELISQPQATL